MVDTEIPEDVLNRLSACAAPRLIGVRHHSAALARAMPHLLHAYRPQAILLEMPPDYQSWLPYLGREDLVAPVALAACNRSELLSFYPLADFSPELAAIRWAAKHDVPVIPCDLGLRQMAAADRLPDPTTGHAEPNPQQDQGSDRLLRGLMNRYGVRDSGELWEKLVETPASNGTPESIRRAALLFGWLIRHSSDGPSLADAHRETAMRTAIAAAPSGSVAVVGSFHAAALMPQPLLWSPVDPLPEPDSQATDSQDLSTSLIPYSFAQLDQRSGYPAGVMDPVWQQMMLAIESPEEARPEVNRLAVELCRCLRDDGHVAGTPDAIEIVRLAYDLCRLRRFPSPGRGEFLEAIETTLVQGDLLGRGRAIAAAAQTILVGQRRGRLPQGTPRSGLAVRIEATIARLKLPGPDSLEDEPRQLRLDPLRSKLDRARAVLLRRLNLIGVRYAERLDTEGIGQRENLTEVWQVQWSHGTAATVEASGMYGVTIEQAAQAALRRLEAAETGDGQSQKDSPHPTTILAQLSAAAECGLAETVRHLLSHLDGSFRQTASANHLIEAASIVQRIAAGHIAGLPLSAADTAEPDVLLFTAPPESLNSTPLVESALRALEGLRGSSDPRDVVALIDLTAMIRSDASPEDSQPRQALAHLLPPLMTRLRDFCHRGSPLMQGAAWGGLAMLAEVDRQELAAVLSGWFDGGSTSEGRRQLRDRIGGLMIPLLPSVTSDPSWLDGLHERLAATPDDVFLARAPALRHGFGTITPADRARLLRDRLDLVEPTGPQMRRPMDRPGFMVQAAAADRAGRAAVAEVLPDLMLPAVGQGDPFAPPVPIGQPPGQLSLSDRWRLILGVQGAASPQACRVAGALDQLYGGSIRADRGQQDDLAEGGGTESATPSAREWVEDVTGLFGKDVCEEVVGEAAASGRAAVLEHLNPDTVRPSVQLLEQVLSLRGALPERDLALLRRLARRITERLAEQLANRLRPALSGLSTPRPTRRRSRRLDLSRTLQDNLDTAYRHDDGRIRLAPRRMIFRTPAKRQMDWHLIFVVDVSGSMEASVIYSALVAAIFSALPAIDVRFFAFSTEVIDFSGEVDDPLSLLLEVQVGGGTHIGLGLRAAREAMKNPSRTLVVLVSDFEEGVSIPQMLSEIRLLADSGAKLLGLAALDDTAKPRYNVGTASAVAAAGMPVAAVSPERLAQWVGDQIRGATR